MPGWIVNPEIGIIVVGEREEVDYAKAVSLAGLVEQATHSDPARCTLPMLAVVDGTEHPQRGIAARCTGNPRHRHRHGNHN